MAAEQGAELQGTAAAEHGAEPQGTVAAEHGAEPQGAVAAEHGAEPQGAVAGVEGFPYSPEFPVFPEYPGLPAVPGSSPKGEVGRGLQERGLLIIYCGVMREPFCRAAVKAGSVTHDSPTTLKLGYSSFSSFIHDAMPVASA